MKAAPLLVSWHNDNTPIYSAHFEPDGKGRLATAGGDGNVRLWSVETNGEERKVTYLSSLVKHTQAVNVVRWCPRGELLASAGDDGNVLLWVPSEGAAVSTSFGDDTLEDSETWRVKTMCRSNNGSEIYDLAWSPDGKYFITGSMDNVARIYEAASGKTVRQIAEHNHYVQGVAWDPLNEYVATQSSDRSVHIYTLKTKDGAFSLDQHSRVTKMDLPGRRISSNSPAPPDFAQAAANHRASFVQDVTSHATGSPAPSAPGTPQSLALPMNPPPTTHSRRSSFGSQMGQSVRRSVSPSPSMPLPAVMPSASPSVSGSMSMGVKNTNIYANETFTSFFRRLTFAPDGSLLFTPAGQYKTSHPSATDAAKTVDDTINTVYIYTRAGLNKPPVAYLPGHKKPSIAVKCSKVYYTIRNEPAETKEITIDTRTEDDIPSLPEPAVPTRAPAPNPTMEPPPLTSAPSPAVSAANIASPRPEQSPAPPAGPQPAFSLPYRIVYAVATQDAVHVYDTQQTKPLAVVSNLHYATFTDLTWSGDGQTLLMTSSDGFCSALSFAPGELGTVHHPPANANLGAKHPAPAPISINRTGSAQSIPQPTATNATSTAPPPPLPATLPRQPSNQSAAPPNPSPSPFTGAARPASPARSMSASSNATQSSSFAQGAPDQNAGGAMNYPTPSLSSVPSVAAAGSNMGGMPLFTPPQTPGHAANSAGGGTGAPGLNQSVVSGSGNVVIAGSVQGTGTGGKRDSESIQERESATSAVGGSGVEDGSWNGEHKDKRRRIAPTPVNGGDRR